MAYNKQQIYNQAEAAIKENKLLFIEDIVAWLPISKATFYEFFPTESDELNNLKSLLETNKVQIKSAIRKKLFKSEKAAELLALYRLVCTKEEHQLLNQQYIDHKSSDGSMTPAPTILVSSEATKKGLDELING